MATKEEAQVKEAVWLQMNRDWVEKQAAKEAALAQVAQGAGGRAHKKPGPKKGAHGCALCAVRCALCAVLRCAVLRCAPRPPASGPHTQRSPPPPPHTPKAHASSRSRSMLAARRQLWAT
jgi:hypothetical protein